MNLTKPRDLGVPVKSVNWARVFAGQRRNGEPLLLAVMGQDNGGLFVCDIDPATGHCTQYSVGLDHASFPTASCFSDGTGVLYIGSAYTGHLHRYDSNLPDGERQLEDLGAIDAELARFPCAIDEAPDGTIYIGAHPGCSLTRFDPRTSTFTRFGRMAEDEMYFYPACGSDGTIAGVARTRDPRVIVFEPQTRARHELCPRASAENGETLEIQKDEYGFLYSVLTHGKEQRFFSIANDSAIEIRKQPASAPRSTLPDGSTVEFLDGHINDHRKLQITAPDGASRVLLLDWQGGGTSLFLVHHGPDDKIYGSSILPEHLFVCDRDGADMRDLGACSEAIGEAYSMANYEGKIYIASYPGARISIYDPSQPYHFGTSSDSNPRDIGRLDDVSYRPRVMLAGPAQKIWIGSIPDYGMLGGTLVWYDPATGESKSHRHVVRDCSVMALEWLPETDEILVGTSIVGGNGARPTAQHAPFVLWNPHHDEAVWIDELGLGINDSIIDIKYSGSGNVNAVVVRCLDPQNPQRPMQAELVLIDVAARKVLDRSLFQEPEWPLEVSLRTGPDGALYGCCSSSFYRIPPGTAQRETLWSIPVENGEDHIHAPGPIVGSTLYFGSGHRLRALEWNGNAH